MAPMMFWQVDSFTNKPFHGNPAAVFILDKELPDLLMQNIAMEMNLPETAFVVIKEDGNPFLRWFTPTFEMDLCGHATLASAHIYMDEIFQDLNEVVFDTKFVGPLKVERLSSGYRMDVPSRLGEQQLFEDLPNFVLDALTNKAKPYEAYKSRDLMLVYEDEDLVRNMEPDFKALAEYKDFVIVTAKSNAGEYDFISRFFSASDGVMEDPVTGSAHCTLAPYWAKKLGKSKLTAYQASNRGGELFIENFENRVLITGQAITVISGQINI